MMTEVLFVGELSLNSVDIFTIVWRIFADEMPHFNRNPCNREFYVKAKDFPTQIFQWVQIAHADLPRSPCLSKG